MAEKEGTTATFDYIKAGSFRVVHVDGAFGGVSPAGDTIVTSFYSERSPIPTRIVHELGDDGRIGKELDRTQRSAVVREVEVATVMDLSTAVVFHKWLGDKIEGLQKTLTKREKLLKSAGKESE